ncbi:hypothetical protein FB451DRAFT_1400577 [Mycena latifolia]|nr:hypothetical protein FB451DRAFT_1400577 [Mycena latifolia]
MRAAALQPSSPPKSPHPTAFRQPTTQITFSFQRIAIKRRSVPTPTPPSTWRRCPCKSSTSVNESRNGCECREPIRQCDLHDVSTPGSGSPCHCTLQQSRHAPAVPRRTYHRTPQRASMPIVPHHAPNFEAPGPLTLRWPALHSAFKQVHMAAPSHTRQSSGLARSLVEALAAPRPRPQSALRRPNGEDYSHLSLLKGSIYLFGAYHY